MEPTNIDRLFALKALEKRVGDERKLVECECRDELLEAYGRDGTDRRTSPFFGPDAGKFSVRRAKAKPGGTAVEFNLADDEALAEWLESNPGAAAGFAVASAPRFAEWWFSRSGEVPEGVARVEHEVPGAPESLSAQVYGFKPELVMERLVRDGALGDAGRMLLGDGA